MNFVKTIYNSISIPLLIVALVITVACEQKVSSNKESWLKWKAKLDEVERRNPTSFLNATSLAQAKKGEKLHLTLDKITNKTSWSKKETLLKKNAPLASATNEGNQVRLKINTGNQEDILISNTKTRSYEFETDSGEFAKIYHGRKHGKTWAYIFDPDRIKKFEGYSFYPYSESAYVDAFFTKIKPVNVQHRTFQGDAATVRKIGFVTFKYLDKNYQLSAYNWQEEGKENGFALIFTDNSSGKKTYGGGRELSIKIDNSAILTSKKKFKIDFNKARNFSCAHNPLWHCPVGLQENLSTLLKAGELLPMKI